MSVKDISKKYNVSETTATLTGIKNNDIINT